MFVKLLFCFTLMLTQLEAEWVEISQQHYLKPVRPADTPDPLASQEQTIRTSTPRNKNTNPTTRHRPTATTETTAKRLFSNTSSNPQGVKGNVLKVPASVARVEHVKKPASDNKHSTGSKSVVVKENDPELDLEIYELTLPTEKTETATRSLGVRKPLVNKGSNRIYIYGTSKPNEDIKATTEKIRNVHHTTIKGSKPNKRRGGNQNTNQRDKSSNDTLKFVNSIQDTSIGTKTTAVINPFLNKNSNRRIYIHGSSGENIHSIGVKNTPTSIKNSESNKEVKITSKGSSSKNHTRSNPRTTESPGNYTTVKNIRPHGSNRIYINQIIKSQDGKHSPATSVPAVFRPQPGQHTTTTTTIKVDSSKESNISHRDLSSEQSDELDKSQSYTETKNPEIIKKNNLQMKNVIRVDKHPSNQPKDDMEVVAAQSEDSGIVDQIPIDYNTPIRRIDISSITSPNDPEFITKLDFIDEDDAKHMFKDYEVTVPTPNGDRVVSGSSSAQYAEEVSVEHYDDVIVDPPKLDNFYDKYEQYTDIDKDNHKNIVKPNTNPKDNIETNGKHTVPSEEKQPRPIENVMKFMKVVSDTISKNTHRSIKSKMRYLEDLRDTLLMNIEQRIDSAWPDEAGAGAGARGRRSARGHVEFPSSEGALMSISFLTFAVFLIKLVLQVIHTYKNKAMMMTPAVVAISRAAAALKKP